LLTIVVTNKLTNWQVTKQQAFINEFHYRNEYITKGRFVEVAIADASVKANTLGLALYAGSNGTAYQTLTIQNATAVSGASAEYVVWEISYMPDETPNGIALYDTVSKAVIEFISYGGGSFKAVGGVANGMVTTDIGYEQSEDNDSANSLQRIGVGAVNIVTGGQWVLAPRTKGALNVLQNFGTCSAVRNQGS
jgi:uncharacterized protein